MAKMQLLSVEESAAIGAKLANVDVCAHHPMPFSADIADELKRIHPVCNFIECYSLSAAVNAAIGASLGGKRVLVPTSVPKSIEDIYTAAYMRLHMVFVNISRPLGTYSIKHDHSDIAALMDAGCLVFMPESNHDLITAIIQAYKVSEELMMPSIVNVDFANYMESMMPFQEQLAKRFVGKINVHNFDRKQKYFAVPDDNYAEYKKQQHKAMKAASESIDKVSKMWRKKTKQEMPSVEAYKLEDADLALVIAGYHSTTAKAAVDKLRSAGKKVGLLRLRVIRPWPSNAIENALKSAKRVAVIDQAVSLGRHGLFYGELNNKSRCSNFISLGARLSEKDFFGIFERLEKSGKDEIVWV